jgi:glycosyltransferase involved in cell wall biosynthesis
MAALGGHTVHWGANIAEVEFMRYRPRTELTRILERYDLIQVVAGTAAWVNSVTRARRPIVLQVATRATWERQSQLDRAREPLRTWRRAMTRATTRLDRAGVLRSDVVLVENDRMRTHVESVGQPAVRMAPPGVDVQRFAPPPGGWCRGGYLLSVCRLGDHRKGLDRLISAYARIRARMAEAPRLVLAGRGELAGSNTGLIERLGLNGFVDVLSDIPVTTLVDLYRGASVFVQPSHEEGLGLSVLEAMACGLPTVATDTAGSRQTVIDGVTGWRVRQTTDEEAVQGIAVRVMDVLQGEHGHRFGRAAREHCVDRFSTDVALRTFVDEYDRLLRDRPTTS